MSYGQRSANKLSFVTGSTIFCLAGMVICGLAYAAIRPDFIPTPELERPMMLTSLLMAYGLGHSFAGKQFKELKDGLTARNGKAAASRLRNFIVAGFLIWFIPLAFFSGPMSYLSHVSIQSADMVRTISVIEAIPGTRRCANRATLQLGGDSVWTSRLCRITDRETEQLRHGGTIRAHGVFTRYGMQIKSFEIIQPHSAGRGCVDNACGVDLIASQGTWARLQTNGRVAMHDEATGSGNRGNRVRSSISTRSLPLFH